MNMRDYLAAVSDQIRCRRAWPMIEKELQAHMEDQKTDYMAEGMTGKEAEEAAVRQMGDPVETGMSLDRIHRPRMNWQLLLAVLVLAAAGIVLQWLTYQQPDSAYKSMEIWRQVKYMIAGTVIMMGLCLVDYSFIGKYAGKIWIVTLVAEIFIMGFNYLHYGGMWINGALYSPASAIADCLLLPAFGGMLWKYRESENKGLVKSVGWLAAVGALFLIPFQNHYYAAVTFGLCGVMLCLAVGMGWYEARWKKSRAAEGAQGTSKSMIVAVLLLIVIAGILLILWRERVIFAGGPYYGITREDVKNLAMLDKTGVDLTGSEIEWVRFDVRGDFLWLYLFYSFGPLPVFALTVLAALFLAFLYRAVFRQKNKLGFILGAGCALFLTVQTLLYLGMNLGIIPPGQGYMPFCTQGGSNLVVTYIYTGLLLSVYRNSRVVRN